MSTISRSPSVQRTSLPMPVDAPSKAKTSTTLTAAASTTGSSAGRVDARQQTASPTQPSTRTAELRTSERSGPQKNREVFRESESEAGSSVSASEEETEALTDFLSTMGTESAVPAPQTGTHHAASPALSTRQPLAGRLSDSEKEIFRALKDADWNSGWGFFHTRDKVSSDPMARTALADYKAALKSKDSRTEYTSLQTVKNYGDKNTRPGSILRGQLSKESEFRSLIDARTGGVRDKRTGLCAELRSFYADGKDVRVLCFPGTGTGGLGDAHAKINVQQFTGIGGVPKVYEQACSLAKEIRKTLPPDVELQVAGISMGGGIANYVGLMCGLPATCVNAAALGGASLKALRQQGKLTQENIAHSTHFRIKGDAVSSPKTQQFLAAALLTLGHKIRVPMHVGVIREAGPQTPGWKKMGPIERHLITAFQSIWEQK